MASTIDKIKSDIIEAMNASQKKTSAYDTEAEIVRVDGNTAWVHIAGGVTETPVALTINAKKGDKVQVRVTNGGAWLMGNATAPPTDDAKANEADKKAAEAKYLAVDAVDAALKADIAAQDAVDSAETARTAAETAQEIAESVEGIAEQAKENAGIAYNSASLAINQLGIVEDIVGVLTLVEQNGVYERTLDTAPQQDKWYFERSGSGTEQDPYVYTRVENPTGNPQSQGYYENTGWSYFELTGIDETLQNYISDHIVYAGGVLSLQNGSTRVSLSTDANAGLTFYNAGTQVAQYGSSATIGDPNGYHIVLQNSRLSFYSDAVTEVAFIDGDQLFINKSVVIQQMDVGDSNGMWSWKVHLVNGRNNMYLKWLG